MWAKHGCLKCWRVSPFLFCTTLLIAPNSKSASFLTNTKHRGDAFKAQCYKHIFFSQVIVFNSMFIIINAMLGLSPHLSSSLISTLNFVSHSIAQGHSTKRHVLGSLQSALVFIMLNKLTSPPNLSYCSPWFFRTFMKIINNMGCSTDLCKALLWKWPLYSSLLFPIF